MRNSWLFRVEFQQLAFFPGQVGAPVLISDQTPWQDLDEAGVGWVQSLNHEQGFVDVIEQMSKVDSQVLAKQRILTRRYALDLAAKGQGVKANKELFTQILS